MTDVRRSSNPDASPGAKIERDRQLSPTGILPPASIVQVDELNINSNERAVGATAIKVGVQKWMDGSVGAWRLGFPRSHPK